MARIPTSGSPSSFKELLDSWKLYAEARGFSDDYIGHMRRCVGYFSDFLPPNTRVGDITVDDYRRFMSYLRERTVWDGHKAEKGRRLTGTTVNTYARAIKAFFAWLKTDGIILNNPLSAERAPKKPKTVPKVYTEDDFHLIFEVAAEDARDEAVLNLFLDSGLRLEEQSSLKIGDIDLKNGTARVLWKGAIERVVLYGPDTAASLERYIKENRSTADKSDPLFVTRDGRPLSASGMQSLLLRLGKKAGIKERLAPHKLRYSFATLSLKYGANLEYLKILMGHSDVKTTSESYLNVPDADIKAAYGRFSPVSNLKASFNKQVSKPPDVNHPETETELPGKPAVHQESPMPPEQTQLLLAIKELLTKFANDINAARPTQAESDWMTAKAKSVLQPDYRRLYDNHIQASTKLVTSLIEDIDHGNIVKADKIWTGPKPAFDLSVVYVAQTERLWPFLVQHLNFEFTNPPLEKQIEEENRC